VAIASEFARARDASADGHHALQAIDPSPLPPAARAEMAEQRAVGELLYRTFVATVNTIRVLRLTEQAHGQHEKIRPTLSEIAADELDNARAARKLYQSAPWLNHNLRLDVGMNDSVAMLDEKIRLLEAYVAGE
jgi:hypothetical protein